MKPVEPDKKQQYEANAAKVAIIGSGNIGTDLMIKIIRDSSVLQMAVLVGIDPASEGLKLAQKLGVSVTSNGMQGLVEMPEWEDIRLVFDATSAAHHIRHSEIALSAGKVVVDLTPAAIGPYVVPVINGDEHLECANVNMVTCGGQATIPVVGAVSSVATVHYAEIVASIASKSAGPGTRANIDEFTETTSSAIEKIGGARKGKAIIVLNPAEPPLIMRDTVITFSSGASHEALEAAVVDVVNRVQNYVPGYRLKQKVQFEDFGEDDPLHIPGYGDFAGTKSSVFLEVEGAAHYLPAYAGNLDIMTSAAKNVAERIAFKHLAPAAKQ